MILWFEIRNEQGEGPAALSLKDIEYLHNYGLKYLAERKFTVSFWTSVALLGAIKPKFEAYLKGIAHRTKLLKETPRKEAKSGDAKITVKGFFNEFQPKVPYQRQTQSDILIELIMDEGTCGTYGDCSRAMAEKIDDHSKENIEALVALAVMELQFFRGCDVDWKKPEKDGAVCEESAQAVSDGEKEIDDKGEEEGKESDVEGDEEEDQFDFTQIDTTDVLSDKTLQGLRYPDPDKFMKRRECFAMAMLMFLSEDLSCKLSELSGEVHAGWKKAFGKPIDFEQLLRPPEDLKDAFDFTDSEQEWLEGTVRYFVEQMSLEQLESLAITDEHLEELQIPKPEAKANLKATKAKPATKAKAAGGARVRTRADSAPAAESLTPETPKGKPAGRSKTNRCTRD